MTLVKTVRPHGNAFGATYEKALGEIYECPDPQPLIDRNIVEIFDGEADGQGGRPSRARAGASKPAEGDGA